MSSHSGEAVPADDEGEAQVAGLDEPRTEERPDERDRPSEGVGDSPEAEDPAAVAVDEPITREGQVVDLGTLLEYAYSRSGSRVSSKAVRRLKGQSRPDEDLFVAAEQLGRDDPLLVVPPALLVACLDPGVRARVRTFVLRLLVRGVLPSNPLVTAGGCTAVAAVVDGASEQLARAVEQARAVDDEVLARYEAEKERGTFVRNLALTLVLVIAIREEWEPRRVATELDALLWSEAVPPSTLPLVVLADGERDEALGVLMAIDREELAAKDSEAIRQQELADQRVRYFQSAANQAEERATRAEASQEDAEASKAELSVELERARKELASTRAAHDDSQAHANYGYERLRAGTLRQITSHRRLVAEAMEILQQDPHMTDVISDRLEAVLRGLDGQAGKLERRENE